MRTRVPRKLSAVAGIATNPLSSVVKAAEKHLAGVIQAKDRAERQAEIRQSVVQQARDTRFPVLNPDHGRHVFIYSNRGTGQVIYSLTREINHGKAKAQLTFVGKKSVPAQIRPDLWNPVAIVTFPTAKQGLDAFRILREFRLRHEYEWRDHLEDRNNLPGKHRRMRMLQNQRPNSIADLAATLARQERLGREQLEKRLDQFRLDEEQYETGLRQLEEVDAKLQELHGSSADGQSERKNDLLLEKSKIEKQYSEYFKRHKAAEEARAAAIKEANSLGLEDGQTGAGKQSSREAFIQRRQLELRPSILSKMLNYGCLPKRGARRMQMIRDILPDRQIIPTMQGVKVMWASAQDRGFAESWPEKVEHEVMGIFKGVAPDPEQLREEARWMERATMLLEKYEGDNYSLVTKPIEEWNLAEARDYRDYLTIVNHRVRKQLRAFTPEMERGEKLGFEKLAVIYEIYAVADRLEVMRRIVMAVEFRQSIKPGAETEQSTATAAALARNVALSLDTVNVRLHRVKLLRGEINGLEEQLLRGLYSVDPRWMREHEVRAWDRKRIARVLRGIYQQELTEKEIRILFDTLAAAKGPALTPEEKRLIANVELDGESSGKNEGEDADSEDASVEDPRDNSTGVSKEERRREKLEEKRQEEERKGLWSRMFGQSSSSSHDDRPKM